MLRYKLVESALHLLAGLGENCLQRNIRDFNVAERRNPFAAAVLGEIYSQPSFTDAVRSDNDEWMVAGDDETGWEIDIGHAGWGLQSGESSNGITYDPKLPDLKALGARLLSIFGYRCPAPYLCSSITLSPVEGCRMPRKRAGYAGLGSSQTVQLECPLL